MRRLALMTVVLAMAAPGLAPAQVGPCPPVSVQHSQPAWTPIFQGIDLAYITGPGPDLISAEALRIDLTAPGIGFVASPHAGSQDVRSQDTGDFLVSAGAAVAVNANLFWPCCDYVGGAGGVDTLLQGLVVTGGQQVSGQMVDAFEAGTGLVTITAGNQVTIQPQAALVSLANVQTAVAGSAVIINGGVNTACWHNPRYAAPDSPNARTLIGLSQDGQTLYLVTVDGGDGNGSGVLVTEAAALMRDLGAWWAVNLDGGGSTSMVQANGSGGFIVLNKPSHGNLRFVGASLGVMAQPISTAPPAKRP